MSNKVTMKPALLMTYASILEEEKQVMFLIDGETMGLVTEHVSEPDIDFNVDFYTTEDNETFKAQDGGFYTGDEYGAIEFVVDLYNHWLQMEAS